MEDVEAIVRGLSDSSRRAVLAFAPAFSRSSSHGMAREWADVCHIAGPRRSYYNTIRPLVSKGVAERVEGGPFVRLTPLGLAVRTYLLSQTKE